MIIKAEFHLTQHTMILKMQVNGNASPSLTSNNSTLTTNIIFEHSVISHAQEQLDDQLHQQQLVPYKEPMEMVLIVHLNYVRTQVAM